MKTTEPSTRDVEAPTLALAAFASNLRLGGIPPATVERVRACLLDTVGCAAFGSTQPWSRIVCEWVRQQQGVPRASLWTTDFRGPAASVVLGVGTMAHAFDMDDYHNTKVHPGVVVAPAAVAVAEAHGLSGRRTLAAIVAGYEVMIRVSLAAGPGPARMRGWHLTGVCGTLGAAAAASNLLGLDKMTTASALGMAGTQSSGLWAFTADGAMSKRFHPGRAAQSGIMAAELAQLGYWGPRKILEADDGGLLAAISPTPESRLLVEGLGEEFHAGDTGIKPYAACGSLHAAVDAVLALGQEYPFEPENVKEIVLHTTSVTLRQCGFRFEPTSVLQAQMSAQYVLAVSLVDGQCLTGQFTEEKMHDPRVLALAERVRSISDPEVEKVYPAKWSAIVDIALDDGRRLSLKVDEPKGSAGVPLTNDDVRAKFMGLAGSVYGEDRCDAIAAAVGRLEAMKSIGDLAALLSSRQPDLA